MLRMRRSSTKTWMLLVGIVAALASAGAAMAAPPVPHDFTTTLTLGDGTPTYGESSTLTGSLTYVNPGDQTVGLADASVGISQSALNATGCVDPFSAWQTVTTDLNGDYSYGPFVLNAAGNWLFQSHFDGTVAGVNTWEPSSSTCLTVAVAKAPTDTAITNTPVTTLALGNTLSVDYKVESAYGVSGNTTGGTASIKETDALTTLGCGSGDTLSAAQSAADGTGAADAGFSATGTLTCTPTAVGSYTYNVNYSGDDNYLGSNSSPDQSLDVTQATVQVCKAAPAIAVEYMKAHNIKPGSSTWQKVITDVAHQTGSNGEFFAKNACENGYADSVRSYINAHYGI